MLCSRSDTYRTAWLRRTALTVMVRFLWWCGGSVGSRWAVGTCWSGGDAEAAGPGDLLVRGEGELQEAEGLELTGPLERSGVDGVDATGGDDPGEGGLGVGVVTGDQDRGGQRAHGAGGEGAREGGVEGLEDLGVRQGGGDLGGGGAVGRDDEVVEGLEVERVGDVDDDLAGELLAALGDDVGDGGVGDGEDDDVTGDGGVDVALAELLDAVAALGRDRRDGLAHVAGADDAEVRHGALLGGGGAATIWLSLQVTLYTHWLFRQVNAILVPWRPSGSTRPSARPGCA